MEDFIETNDGFIQITCHFCFEPFEVQLEVSSENFLKIQKLSIVPFVAIQIRSITKSMKVASVLYQLPTATIKKLRQRFF